MANVNLNKDQLNVLVYVLGIFNTDYENIEHDKVNNCVSDVISVLKAALKNDDDSTDEQTRLGKLVYSLHKSGVIDDEAVKFITGKDLNLDKGGPRKKSKVTIATKGTPKTYAKPKPKQKEEFIAIYNTQELYRYNHASAIIRNGWEKYVAREAAKYDATVSNGEYAKLMFEWTPEMYFSQWVRGLNRKVNNV